MTGYLASTSQDYQSNKRQERLRDCHRPGKTREMWQLSEMQYSELDPAKEKETLMEKLTKFKTESETDIDVQRPAHWKL